MRILVSIILLFLCSGDALTCTVDISSIKAKAIYGKVIAEDGTPVPDALVQIYRNLEEGEVILAEIKADENGRFEMQNFAAGKYMIRAKSNYFAVSIAIIKLKKSSSKVRNREIVFTLVPDSRCSGWVEMRKIGKTK
ncbi:MAG TPA: carboxypeptidase-like regulatory domain-containing protein [Pyrinomonadaceae bacterium]|nr:carboxypeptidase-like regulatory domain-containing protein [Pyrinomonadaceae bacterium]